MSTSPKIVGGLCLLGLTVAGIALGAYAGTTDGPVKPVNTPTVTVTASPTIHEDDPGWDCETMGNRVCGPAEPTIYVDGPAWSPVTPELADALAEGDDTAPENATTREWETCLVHGYPGDAITVVCPDGYVTSQ